MSKKSKETRRRSYNLLTTRITRKGTYVLGRDTSSWHHLMTTQGQNLSTDGLLVQATHMLRKVPRPKGSHSNVLSTNCERKLTGDRVESRGITKLTTMQELHLSQNLHQTYASS